jgi:phage gp46-like protein
MQDIKLIKDEDISTFDIAITNGDIDTVDNFDSAINASLLLDARASSPLISPERSNGWLGNLATPVRDRQLGSLLWLLSQARLTQTNVNEAVDYARKALNWLVEDGICKNVTVSGEIIPRLGIRLTINIFAFSGRVETQYYNLWEATGGN